jgi:TfoX/Sxy family transcriptional regulator of competence genes
MAYDEGVAQRVREALADERGVVEKKMFGGIAFMLRGNMCCGVVGEELMLRVGPDGYDEALAEPHARPMDFTGRPMRGMVYVAAPGFESDADLAGWIERAARFARRLPPK